MQSFFATCARGLESVLADELTALDAGSVKPARGGVHFSGDLATLYQANLWLRTAIRVLRPVLTADVHSPEELYDAVISVDWSRYLTPDHTLAVDCNVRDSAITHSHYAALKTKDAICDWFVDKCGRRPNVNVDDPMIPFNLHIDNNQAVLSLDSSGTSLHKRGYRAKLHRAALNEALAAGLVQLAGWDGQRPFVDPLCGSGTLLIEAAWLALRRPPALTRKHFPFQRWLDFDIDVWMAIRDEARRQVLSRPTNAIVGADRRRDVIDLARSSARAAGCGNAIEFLIQDLSRLQPTGDSPGVLLCNPPYGRRLGEEKELGPLYRSLGNVLRERFSGWRVFIFSGNARLLRQVDLEAADRTPLFNGKIPCQLVRFEVE